MSKNKKVPKVPKEETDIFYDEVVLMDDVCQIIMKTAFESLDILRSLTFSTKCNHKTK